MGHVLLEPQVDIWILFDSSYLSLAHLENLTYTSPFAKVALFLLGMIVAQYLIHFFI